MKATRKLPPTTTQPSRPATEIARAEIENGVHALETLLEAAVDKNFDIFELFALQNIFAIKPDVEGFVRLAHYEGLEWPVSDVTTLEKVAGLRRWLRAERELGLALEKEGRAMDGVLVQLRALTAGEGGLGVVLGDGLGQGVQSLTTTAQFSTSQLPGLRVLLADLRAKMALLPATAEELRRRNVGRAAGEEERRRYVERVAKRAVREKLGSDVSGEHALGPMRSMAEVEALEALIHGIVKEGKDGDDEDEDDVD